MIGKCKLCGADNDLKLSHIVPSFIFKWFKETSGTGYIRSTANPNLRTQDGIKEYWLCENCESLFNLWETEFSKRIFYPIVEAKSFTQIRYNDWLLKFSVSLCWRVLFYAREKSKLTHLAEFLSSESEAALETWAAYLLGKIPNPGKREVHLIPLNGITNFTYPNMPSNINRYLLRSVEIDIPSSSKEGLVYIKLPYFMVVGFINVLHPAYWKGTKLRVNNGILGSRKYILPKMFGEYMIQEANKARQALDKMSGKQQLKINESIIKNSDRFISSDFFKAMNYDIELFGKDVFE